MIKIGTKIDDRYRLTAFIGQGGMADVYEAYDIILKREVAIKIIKDSLANDAKNLKRFEDEIMTCSSLDHPNIIHVFNSGDYENRPYVVNELIEGQTLKQKLEFITKFSYHEALLIVTQLCEAVKYIHEHKIVHRDIKTQNIFYLSDGTVKLGDFGIASYENQIENQNQGNAIVGSVHYLAPEISVGEKASYLSDIYAIGVTFFELVTGRLPYQDGEAVDIAVCHINKPFPSPKEYCYDLPDYIEKIIFKCTKKEPNERYQSCDDLLSDLHVAYENMTVMTSSHKGFFARIFGGKK